MAIGRGGQGDLARTLWCVQRVGKIKKQKLAKYIQAGQQLNIPLNQIFSDLSQNGLSQNGYGYIHIYIYMFLFFLFLASGVNVVSV